MSAVTERVTLSGLTGLHGPFTIDVLAYQSNPELTRLADEILELAGFTADDVHRDGITVHRHGARATMRVFERTSDGKNVVDGDEVKTRTVEVNLPNTVHVNVTALGDLYESYLAGEAT